MKLKSALTPALAISAGLLAAMACDASSMIRVPSIRAASSAAGDAEPDPHCEIRGRFLKETHSTIQVVRKGRAERRERVRWLFAIDETKPVGRSRCPARDETFELAVTAGDFVSLPDGTSSYVYPDYIAVPEKGAAVILRARRVSVRDPGTSEEYTQWIPVSWQGGVEIQP